MKRDIIDIVDLVRNAHWYNGTEYIEIAKGKNQIAHTWQGFKRKLRRALK